MPAGGWGGSSGNGWSSSPAGSFGGSSASGFGSSLGKDSGRTGSAYDERKSRMQGKTQINSTSQAGLPADGWSSQQKGDTFAEVENTKDVIEVVKKRK
ncbi:unnamed protein product [Toxocara canis]|uniref:Keratin, type I cytoskeletal 9-like n=1 Tax=Toxocara canis TaxID=6265 RepID=A0A183U3E4_TOXCA|nr:unnamed protein product [Toxocara canis]